MAEIRNILMQTANLLGFRSIWEENKTGDSSKSLGFLFDLHMDPLEIPQNPGSGACSRGPVSNEIKTYVERRKNSMRNAPLPGGNPQMSNAKETLHRFWPPDFRSIDGRQAAFQIPVALREC